jgi:hypothetical protein
MWLGQEVTTLDDGIRYHSAVRQVDTANLVKRGSKSNWTDMDWRSMGYGCDVGEGGSERASRGEIKA